MDNGRITAYAQIKREEHSRNILWKSVVMNLTKTKKSNFEEIMSIIKKQIDLSRLCNTELFLDVKARCGIPPNTEKISPKESCWSLLSILHNREYGPTISSNQQRKIANNFIPNSKECRLMSLDDKVTICKFNESGEKLVTACQSFVRLYDSSKGTYHRLNRIKTRDVFWNINDVDFSPDGQTIAYSSWSKSVSLVKINGSEDDFNFIDVDEDEHRFAIFSLRYSACGDKIISGTNTAAIYVSDLCTRTSDLIRTHRRKSTDINAVSFVSKTDPNSILCGSEEGILKLYDLRSFGVRRTESKPVSTFYGHYDGITYIDTRNDGKYVLTNSKDQSIKIWDVRRPSSSRASDNVNRLQWDYRWQAVPSFFYSPPDRLENDCSVMTYRGHKVHKTLLRAKFSPLEQTGSRFIYTGCATGRIIIYDVLTGRIREAIESHKCAIRDLDWHPIRSEIVSGSWDMHVNLNKFNRNNLPRIRKRRNSEDSGHEIRRSRRLRDRNEASTSNRTAQIPEYIE